MSNPVVPPPAGDTPPPPAEYVAGPAEAPAGKDRSLLVKIGTGALALVVGGGIWYAKHELRHADDPDRAKAGDCISADMASTSSKVKAELVDCADADAGWTVAGRVESTDADKCDQFYRDGERVTYLTGDDFVLCLRKR